MKNTEPALSPADTRVERVLPFSTDAELAHRYLVFEELVAGNIRFGLLLEDLDRLAEQCAGSYVRRFYPGACVVTAAIDDIQLRNHADTLSDLQMSARINHVGTSSLEVGIRVVQCAPEPRHIMSCYFTFVALESTADGARTLKLPQLEYRTDLEQHRFHKAGERRASYRAALERNEQQPTLEEFMLLKRLHADFESGSGRGVAAGRLVVDSWQRMYPGFSYNPKTVFGGLLIRKAYELASIAAEQVAPGRVVIGRVHKALFLQKVRLGSKVHFVARVIHATRHTLTVQVDVENISNDRQVSGLSNSCLFTFWCVDEQMEPCLVPFVYPVTYAEDARFLYAHRMRIEE